MLDWTCLGATLAQKYELRNVDWGAFADAWRGQYHPQMEKVRSGRRPWTKLDNLHRESLDLVVSKFGLTGIPAEALDEFNRVWHRLGPWPDTISGLTRIKSHYIIAPNSNGHIALLLGMAKRAGIPTERPVVSVVCHQHLRDKLS